MVSSLVRRSRYEDIGIDVARLRHTYCSLMLTYGIDARTLADLIAHSSASISLNVYSHSYMETKQSYVNTLNDALYVSAN